jgi:ribosomal protein S6--L-glutamate ligase
VKEAKKRGMKAVLINLLNNFDEEKFEQQIKKCDIIYNDSAEEFVLEPLKTVEALGKMAVDSSKAYYYSEDKWLFYIKCRENKIPTPETILLPNNLNTAKAELKKFGKWPVILKRIHGCQGSFVQKADNPEEAVSTIKKIWKVDCDKVPIIAQEMIKSFSYRATIINNKIVQTAIKKSKNWKCTGVYAKKCGKFRVDKQLRKLLKKVAKIMKITVCGVDLLKKDGRWVVLEVNAEPGLDFIDGEGKKLIGDILSFLKEYYKQHLKNHSFE